MQYCHNTYTEDNNCRALLVRHLIVTGKSWIFTQGHQYLKTNNRNSSAIKKQVK